MLTPTDTQWMTYALQLAQRGLYDTSPNPRVGCVLVKDGTIIGEGWHERAGEPHAEVHALRGTGNAKGATVYVTLEPCSHHGRTPPCTETLIRAGVARVVVAMQDPNPQVAGQGLEKLRAAGIEVECGLMEAAALELNIGFFARMTRAMPWVRSKIAASLDGRTALNNGASKWISCEAARLEVQDWRARSCAVLTGIGTVLADDPQLTVRGNKTVRKPLRAVVDTAMRLPLNARLLQEPGVVIYTAAFDAKKIATLEKAGAQVSVLPNTSGQVDLRSVLRDLADRGSNEVLVEAGSKLNGGLLQACLVDELVLYFSPQMLGDMAHSIAHIGKLTSLEQRINLEWHDVRRVGEDLRIVARVKRDSYASLSSRLSSSVALPP